MSIDEIDRQLAELGNVARRMPLPPLPEIHRRAARRHRARIARRTAGAAAAAVVVSAIAFGGSHLSADRGVTPATQPAGDSTSCLTQQTDPKTLDAALLRLPDHVPDGTAFHQAQGEVTQKGCGFPAAGAFAVDAATSSITKSITLTAYPLETIHDGPGSGECRRISLPGQTGTCIRAGITGEVRWSWRTSGMGGWRSSASWAQDGRVWWAHAAGMSSTELDAALAGLRVSGDRVVRGTLPRGLSPWLAPAQDPEVHTLVGRYLPLPADGGGSSQDDPAGDVQIEVTDDPFSVPQADPMAMSGNGGAVRPVRLVDVGDAKATWREDDVDDFSTLTWQADDGVTVRVRGGRLTLDEALRMAGSIRPVARDDERLTCDADKNPWGFCGG
jgi:hypothetical protein